MMHREIDDYSAYGGNVMRSWHDDTLLSVVHVKYYWGDELDDDETVWIAHMVYSYDDDVPKGYTLASNNREPSQEVQQALYRAYSIMRAPYTLRGVLNKYGELPEPGPHREEAYKLARKVLNSESKWRRTINYPAQEEWLWHDAWHYVNDYRQNHPERKYAGYVYLIKASTGHYKIGRTKNPDDRMETFSVKLPFEVEYEALIYTYDAHRTERDFHERFSHKRVNGEWFALDSKDIEYIKSYEGKLTP